MANPWDNDPIVGGPIGGSSNPVIAPPDPYKAADEVRAQRGDQRDDVRLDLQQRQFDYTVQKDQRDQQAKDREEAEKAAKAQRAQESAIYSLSNVLDKIDSVETQAKNGWFDTGRSGAFVRSLPDALAAGSDAYDLAADLQTIDANSAFSALSDMRNNSPTGGALGQVTERELDLLKSTIANLNPNQSEEQFLRNVNEARQAYITMLERLDPAQAAAYRERRKEGGEGEREQEEGLTGSVTDTTPNDPNGGSDGSPIQTSLDPRFHNPSGAQGLFDLAKQGVTLGFSDEAAGIGGALSSIFTGGDALEAYRRERDIERENLRQAREAHPIAGTVAEFLGGGSALRVAPAAVNSLAGIARQGAGIGAVGGFGYGDGAQGSAANAAIGGVAGGALGAGMGAIGNALARRSQASPIDISVVEAGQRQNIPVRQFDARPDLRNRASALETTETAGPMIRAARSADVDAIEARVAEIGGQGNPSDPFSLGSRVQEAGRRYIARTREQANRLYDRARNLSQDATVQPTEALAAIDQNIAELRAAGENSNAGQIAYLEGLRGDLNRPLSVEAVQSLRTNMRGQISERGLTGTDADRRVAQVLDAANRDLVRELPQEASTALRAADDFYRDRQGFINDTLKQFMGSRGNPVPAETAAQRLTAMAQGKGNYERFSSMWKQLEPEEQADVAATIASSLGRKANGEFSAATLIRSLDPSKGINPRTARLVFGEEGAQALRDLRILSQAKTDTQAAMNNSRTGAAINRVGGGLKTFLMAALGFSAGGPGGAAAGAVSREFLSRWGEQRAARMLLNPDFTKWLRNAPNTTNPRAIDRYFSRLSGVMAANDNQAFTQALISIARNSPGRAAAEDEPNARREPVR